MNPNYGLCLGANFFFSLLPVVLVLGTVAALSLAYFKYKLTQATTEVVEDALPAIADATQETADATSKIARSLHELNIYKGSDRKENFLSSVLGTPNYTTLIVHHGAVAIAVLLQKLIQDGWVVEKEIEMAAYEGQTVHVVVSKDVDSDGIPDTLVLDFKVNEYPVTQVKGKVPLEAFTLDNLLEITEGVKIHAGECGADCKVQLRLLIAKAANEGEVKILHSYASRIGRIPISVYSAAQGGFVPDSIISKKTNPAILDLSYNIRRRKAGTNTLDPTTYRLNVGKFIQLMCETTCPAKDEDNPVEPQRFNVGLVGPGGSGKSYLLKALLQEGYRAGVDIVKASAAAFADFTKDTMALASLKQRAERGPTWLVIDEGNGLPQELVAALASVMDGLDSSPNLSVILATNKVEDLSDSVLANLFRAGRVELFLDVSELPASQWKPLASALKAEAPNLNWVIPDDNEPRTLGAVYDMGLKKPLETIFTAMEEVKTV